MLSRSNRRSVEIEIENGEKLRGYTYTYDSILDAVRDGRVARRSLRALLPVPPVRVLRVASPFRISKQVCVTGSPIKSPMNAFAGADQQHLGPRMAWRVATKMAVCRSVRLLG